MKDNIKKQLRKLPEISGVYKFFDEKGELLYIGKATSLKNRVSSYFNKDVKDERILSMVSKIAQIQFEQTDSVLEALILEANLIKKFQPKYNVKLKDDKFFVNIVVTDEEYPAVLVVRPTDAKRELRVRRDMIFGPFPSARMAQEAVEILQKIFLFRSCHVLPNKKCLMFDVGKCTAPCIENISKEEYKKRIKNLVLFLQGKKTKVIKYLEKEMAVESKKENFERAAYLRNQIFALQHIKDISLIKKESSFKNIPYRIEAYDISNISGVFATGSMVVFIEGKVASGEYRKFKIKTAQGANDIEMMKEVLWRRLSHQEWQYPNLIVIDGGKAQFRVVYDTTRMLKLNIPIIAIAKGPTRKKADLIFSENAPRLDVNLIKELRDEAHRFAVKYHRKLREIL